MNTRTPFASLRAGLNTLRTNSTMTQGSASIVDGRISCVFQLEYFHYIRASYKIEKMTKFIELPVAADEDGSETKVQLINIASIGRVYANPQSNRKSIVELNYQSINDAPVFLEVVMPYETIRQLIAANT